MTKLNGGTIQEFVFKWKSYIQTIGKQIPMINGDNNQITTGNNNIANTGQIATGNGRNYKISFTIGLFMGIFVTVIVQLIFKICI